MLILSYQIQIQATILNTNNLQLYGIKYSYRIQIILNRSIWPIDGSLTGTTTPGQNEPRSNGNEVVFHIPQSSRTGASPPDTGYCHTQDTLFGLSYSSSEDAISVFEAPLISQKLN